MAKSRTRAASKKAARPAAPAKAAAPATKASSPANLVKALSLSERSLKRLREHYPPPSDTVIARLRRAHSDASCRELGGQTESEAVLQDGVLWGEKIDDALTSGKHGNVPVSPALLGWFVHCLVDLQEEVAGATPLGPDALRKARVEAAEKDARAFRVSLAKKVRRAVGSDTAWKLLLKAALTPVADDNETASTLRQLGELVAAALGGAHDGLGDVLAFRGITEAHANDALAKAKLLSDALDVRPSAGQVTNDSPATNVAEGRVLYEMRALRSACAEAREDGKTTLVLIPSPKIRHIFTRIEASEADTEGDEPPAADPKR